MIRVTVELISAVSPDRSRVLGIAEIANVGGDMRHGDYSVMLSKWAPHTRQTWKRGTVLGFDRVNRGAWDLLFLALRACVGVRNSTLSEAEIRHLDRAHSITNDQLENGAEFVDFNPRTFRAAREKFRALYRTVKP